MATATRARTTRTASLDMMVGEVLDRKKDELGRGVDAEKERECPFVAAAVGWSVPKADHDLLTI